MRVAALALLGLIAGCSETPKQAPPANVEARRAKLYNDIKTETPFKFVQWECVLPNLDVSHVSLREDSIFVEGVEKSGDNAGMNALYRVNTKTGVVEWVVDLRKPLDFRPSIVGSIVKQLAQLERDRDKQLKDREVERTRKEKDVKKIDALTDAIKQKSDLINSLKVQDRVYAISDHINLHVIERPAGAEYERPRLHFTPSTAAAGSPSIVYIGALDRHRLIGLDPITWNEISYFAADAPIVTTPIYAEPNNVYFASEDGHVYGYTADRNAKLIDYATEAAIVCDMCLDIETDETGKEKWGALFVASTDYALYCFNRTGGDLLWKYETGTQLRTTPQVSGEVAYVFAREKGLHAIDKRTGKLLYIKSDAWFVLARGKDRVYLASANRKEAIAVEERTGKELGRGSISQFAHIVSDPRARTVYFVTDDGFIFAAKESEIDY